MRRARWKALVRKVFVKFVPCSLTLNPAVRRAAVRSARGIGDKRLIEPLIEALFDPLTTNAAGVALAGIGTSAAPRLVALLLDPKTPRTARLQLPRVLRMIPCEVSWQGVHRAASDPDSHLRLRSYAALSQLRARMNRGPLPLHEVRAWILREVNETYSVLAGWSAAKKRFGSPLLDEAIAFREVRGGRRILRILELRYPPEPLRLVRERLDRGAKRGNALELLDNTIDATLRPLVMTFFDDAAVEQKLAEASLPPPPSPVDFMRLQLAHPNPFVVMLALDALTQARESIAITEAKSLLQHADPLVREGAVRTLAMLSPGHLGRAHSSPHRRCGCRRRTRCKRRTQRPLQHRGHREFYCREAARSARCTRVCEAAK